jgi:hypothetical protein
MAIEDNKLTIAQGRNKNCYTKKLFSRIKGFFQVKFWTKSLSLALKAA